MLRILNYRFQHCRQPQQHLQLQHICAKAVSKTEQHSAAMPKQQKLHQEACKMPLGAARRQMLWSARSSNCEIGMLLRQGLDIVSLHTLRGCESCQ